MGKYKVAKKETKNAVSELTARAFNGLYQSLGTKEGGRNIYGLKGNKRKTRYLDRVKCIIDEKSKASIVKPDIKERRKNYFHKLYSMKDVRLFCT